MSPELERIVEKSDNILEAFLAAIFYYLTEIVFKAVEVVVEFGDSTKSPD